MTIFLYFYNKYPFSKKSFRIFLEVLLGLRLLSGNFLIVKSIPYPMQSIEWTFPVTLIYGQVPNFSKFTSSKFELISHKKHDEKQFPITGQLLFSNFHTRLIKCNSNIQGKNIRPDIKHLIFTETSYYKKQYTQANLSLIFFARINIANNEY